MPPRPPDLVYGRNPVLEALRAGRRVKRILLADGLRSDPRLTEIRRRAHQAGAQLEVTDRSRLQAIAHSGVHQGVVAYLDRRRYWDLGALLEAARGAPDPILVLADGVQDPQNLGTLSRTAEAAGAQGLILPAHHAPEVTPAMVKASAGAIEHLRVCIVEELGDAVEALKREGYWVVGLAPEAGKRIDEVDYRRPLALVVGSEAEGIRRQVRERCNVLVHIPLHGHVGSVNAAVAGSILLYEIARQRGSR
jgi:23S rRNA (guanosine2251-2'-O)-methyltransferase